MPPYIIFSDKTLIDMAAKVPTSHAEMLNVSGVGEYKYDKYGSRFLALIGEWIEKYPELAQNKTETNDSVAAGTKASKNRKKTGKMDFFLTESDAEDFKYADFYYISDISNEMNRVCKAEGVKKATVAKISEYLISENLIATRERDGNSYKVQTEKGMALGIKTVEKVSQKGFTYTLLVYPTAVQKMIVNHFIEVGREED